MAKQESSIAQFGEVCEHGSVSALGHDCRYTAERDRFIPSADRLARERCGLSTSGKLPDDVRDAYGVAFLHAMDELWCAYRVMRRGAGVMH